MIASGFPEDTIQRIDMKIPYESPSTRILEVKLNSSMMLLNSNGTTTQTTPDLEEQDYSNIWGN